MVRVASDFVILSTCRVESVARAEFPAASMRAACDMSADPSPRADMMALSNSLSERVRIHCDKTELQIYPLLDYEFEAINIAMLEVL
jgi:hypothetical protein